VLCQSIKPIGFDDISEMPRETVSHRKKSLNVYVKYSRKNLIRVFSVQNTERCSLACQISATDSNQWVESIAIGDYLYSLHYVRRNPKIANISNQSFSAYTSVDMRSSLSLTIPPVIFDDVNLCSIRNNIYAYNQTLSRRIPKTNSLNSSTFNDEEIERGIYVYNCELDR